MKSGKRGDHNEFRRNWCVEEAVPMGKESALIVLHDRRDIKRTKQKEKREIKNLKVRKR